MVATEVVLGAILEFPNVAGAIEASLHSDVVALPIAPFHCIRIHRRESINPITMPQSLPVLPIVSAVHEVIIDPTAIALPIVKFNLIEIPIAVEFDPFP
ncbi:hypothetical protein C1H46_009102 [Malus baccata]|uniref:Uncharacterized protein n=1 Tax=Malus baccata TaxID=106549 RepID=A0A540N2N8_MALBA|nr:hypothetical protein C1H46_009102 [Malus baccata]